MLGNVAEWTADIYRPIIDDEANDFNYFRGNNYKTTIDNGNGGFVKYDETNMEYDTLNNGRLVYKGLPGSYKKETIKDYRNYRDGDAGSALVLANGEEIDTDDMYNSPVRRFVVDANGKVVLEKDNATRTTELSDEVRVVKGGSWRDPIYWVDPGQRRYMHQAEATSWIGFRVAQDFKGTKESKRKRRGV
jgi:hypothetical protein